MNKGWTWELSNRAAERMATLDNQSQQQVLDKLDNVVNDDFRDPEDFTKSLTGLKPWRSLRIGEYRAIVLFKQEPQIMQVGAIGHRSSIYDEFP